jgi:hypothetical protein
MLTLGDTVLLTACLYNCVHNSNSIQFAIKRVLF